MKTSYLCIPCFFRQIENASSLVGLSKENRDKLHSYITKRLLIFDFNYSPVVFGRTIYKTISQISNKRDPFLEEKIRAEECLLKILPKIRSYLKIVKNPLYITAKMSCIANSIDFGTGKIPKVHGIISQLKNAKLYIDHFLLFKKKIKKKNSILVIGDNCGETIFDLLFIEEIKKHYSGIKIFYATRSAPIINDVVFSDAKRIGLNKVAKVLSSGCDYPGIILKKASPIFKKIYQQADIVVSKGQGNFESLWDIKKDIFYLFKVKCPPVSEFLNTPQNSYIFFYNKFKKQ